MSENTKTPMSPERRAAMEKRLAELRALQAAQQASSTGHTLSVGAAPWQPPTLPPEQQPVAQYGYDDDDNGDYDQYWDDENGAHVEEDGDYDRVREEFFDKMEYLHAGGHVDPTNAPVFVAPQTKVHRVVDEFEVLRLAKLGDERSCFEIAEVVGADLKTLVDNHERNTLHYAADSGNLALVQSLLKRGVPFRADSIGLTPLDVAILNSGDSSTADAAPVATALIDTLIAEAAKVSYLSVDQKRLRTVEELCRSYAPKPPGFVMSKPALSAPSAPSKRLFWEPKKAAQTESTGADRITTVAARDAGDSLDAASLVAHLTEMYGTPQNGAARDAWLLPVEETIVRSFWARSLILTLSRNAETQVDGIVVSWMADGHLSSANPKVKSGSAKKLACVSALAVSPSKRGCALAAHLMHATHSSLREAGVDAVAFVTSTLLPSPPSLVSTVKWMRRVTEPTHVFRDQEYTYGVYRDFADTPQRLRATEVLKGHVPQSLFESRRVALMGWSALNREEASQTGPLFDFLQKQSGALAGVELAYVPDSIEALCDGLLADGLMPYAHVVDESITDFVVFRRRVPRAADLRESAVILDLVYAVFTSIKTTEKTDHVLLMAKHLHQADVLYVPTMFGFTESDLVKASFEEDTENRQFLYIGSPQDAPDVSLIPATPASKVALPVFIL